jgi:hypothetical protein
MLGVIVVLSVISTLSYGQSSASGATVPNLVNFAGTLKDSGGHPIQSITGVTFSLYAQEEGGAPLWLETQTVRADGKGNYTVQLGATKAEGLPLELFTSGTARWLGVRINGGEEQPRVLLVSVPYALKAADSQTLGGLPPSAFVLAAPPIAQGTVFSPAPSPADISTAVFPAAIAPAAVSGTGTTDFLPLWTNSTGALGNSILFQSGTGTTAKVGINTTTPAVTLDVNGSENVHGTLNLASTGAATATAGKNSAPLDFTASAYNSSTKTATPQKLVFQAEPVGNDTASAAAALSLLYSSNNATPVETGLKFGKNGVITFASAQTFPGTGTITGVEPGAGLMGGGVKGTVTLKVDATQIPFLASFNTFSSTQEANVSGEIGLLGVSDDSYGLYGTSSTGDGAIGQSTSGNGVDGFSNSGTGVNASSNSLYGVLGQSNTNFGVAGVSTSGNGVFGQTSTATQSGVLGTQENSSGNWALFGFGNIGATGTKSSVVAVDNGARQVALYAVEAPGVWFEDYGSGHLVSGVATVKIDPAYAQTVNTRVEYHVYVTPDGECEGLYVTARTASGFEVRELHQGKSNVAFDYRIIALRRGYETKRLEDVTHATPRANIEIPRPVHARPVARTATVK